MKGILTNIETIVGKFDLRMSKIINHRKILAEIHELPCVKITDFNSTNDLPFRICCLYFVWNEINGILYIGKAYDLRQRWRYGKDEKSLNPYTSHHMMERAIRSGATLSWFTCPKEYTTTAEQMLIKYLKPSWNTIHK